MFLEGWVDTIAAAGMPSSAITPFPLRYCLNTAVFGAADAAAPARPGEPVRRAIAVRRSSARSGRSAARPPRSHRVQHPERRHLPRRLIPSARSSVPSADPPACGHRPRWAPVFSRARCRPPTISPAWRTSYPRWLRRSVRHRSSFAGDTDTCPAPHACSRSRSCSRARSCSRNCCQPCSACSRVAPPSWLRSRFLPRCRRSCHPDHPACPPTATPSPNHRRAEGSRSRSPPARSRRSRVREERQRHEAHERRGRATAGSPRRADSRRRYGTERWRSPAGTDRPATASPSE